jgi:hypothetical protein
MQISQTKEQLRALSGFQANCEIQTVHLLSCSATRAREGATFTDPFKAKPTLSNVEPSIRGGALAVEISFEYTAWDSSDPPERLFCIHCTFEALYRIREEYTPTEEGISSFSRGTAVFNCWPYAREFIQAMISRLGHTAPALPLLRIIPKKAPQDSLPPASAGPAPMTDEGPVNSSGDENQISQALPTEE